MYNYRHTVTALALILAVSLCQTNTGASQVSANNPAQTFSSFRLSMWDKPLDTSVWMQKPTYSPVEAADEPLSLSTSTVHTLTKTQ